ncbi:MAG: sulfatase-like hydrolase/transferase [Candidatus Sulfotelmatobacter sp.]
MKQKSIVLVTVDCLRADHVGFMGYERPTTPFLDSLAGESFVVPTAIVAGAPTYYSFPGILASRYPLALGRDVLGLGPDEPTLASVLKQAGYSTASFGAANPYISARFGYEHGFDTFRDFLENEPAAPPEEKANAAAGNGWASRLNRRLQKNRPALGPLGIVYDELYFEYCQRVTPVADSLDALRRFPAADVIVDHACTWLASVDAPFFLWLHLMDPHSPYYPKDAALRLMEQDPVTPYQARYLNSYWNRSDLGPRRFARHRNEVVALYDAGIRWVDAQMARLTETLRAASRWDDCIFAFTADHGEEFLDHGGRYHPPSRLMEELIHVPLLLRVPGSAKKDVAKSPFSMVHLAPTLLHAAHLPVPTSFEGRSHWEQLRQGASFDGVAISECVAGCTNPFRSENRMGPRVLSVRESRFKLVLHFDPGAENLMVETLYDLDADPGERAPLAPAAQKPVRRRLLEIAREHLRRSNEPRDSRTRVQARLRELRLEWKKPADQASPVAS